MMEHPSFASADLSVAQGDLFRRLDGAGGDRGRSRTAARRALHHRVRPDRVLAGRVDDLGHRHHRRQGRDHRHADAERRGQDRQSRYRTDRRDRRNRRDLHPRLSRHARLLRGRCRDQGGDRFRRLAAHRRSRRDGRQGLLHHRGQAEGHDHSRRREHLSARVGGNTVPPSQGWRRRGDRTAGPQMGRSGIGVYPPRAGDDSSSRRNCTITCASISPRTRPRATGSWSMPCR